MERREMLWYFIRGYLSDWEWRKGDVKALEQAIETIHEALKEYKGEEKVD